jgi:hypothetical protein
MERYSAASEDRARPLRLDARIPGLDGPRGIVPPPSSRICLAVSAHCATARDCDIARAILDSIRIGPATRDEAIALALARYPELARYRGAGLPPHAIEAARDASGGWLLGFIRSGSGVPGILDARCLAVTRFGEVRQTGILRRPANAVVRRLDLAACRPAAT